MNEKQITIGDTAKAIFRKYGKHIVLGEIFEISTDEHGLKGTWVSIKLTSGDPKDKQVNWMIENKINVIVPASDVLEVLQ